MAFRCVLHGSFGKHFDEIRRVHKIFTDAGIEVLAPKMGGLAQSGDGFVRFEDEQGMDQRLVELLYLQNLRHLGQDGFSYFVNPDGYVGKSAAYELGIAQVTNVPCFFLAKPADHPAYVHGNAVWTPEALAAFIVERGSLPSPVIRQDEGKIHALWEQLMVPGSVVAVGGMIEYQPPRSSEKRVLLVRTHKWGNRFSMVGGKVRRHERLVDALTREVKEETGLRGIVGPHVCTFDQIKSSGYYQKGIQHIFVDHVVRVETPHVRLNEEAQEYVWMPAETALRDLDIEPNARQTLELYAKQERR